MVLKDPKNLLNAILCYSKLSKAEEPQIFEIDSADFLKGHAMTVTLTSPEMSQSSLELKMTITVVFPVLHGVATMAMANNAC